jgi:cellulose synthase/poly-beta-1,6-N-acetylglucosamine synthase-like glycosyltransferase
MYEEGDAAIPYVSPDDTLEAIARLTPAEAKLALAERVVPIGWTPGTTVFAADDLKALLRAREWGLDVRALISPGALLPALHRGLGRLLVRSSISGLARRFPEFSAQQPLTARQAGWAFVSMMLAADVYLLAPGLAWFLAGFACSLLFLAVIALRLLSFRPSSAGSPPQPAPVDDADLPVYTVLVPLYRETSVAHGLVEALNALDYPPDKLDIKIILEADDRPMRRLIGRMDLPSQYEVIVVPASRPRTKPKALNFALHFARGELVAVFDAEDIPHPAQLRLAAACFAAAPQNVACFQAALGFFNGHENWLTRQFALEYAVQFTMIFPMLAAWRMPLPLGGTSNHFRINLLRQVGGWDAHNVTEDADLGLRLARCGFRVGTLPSYTAEEASCDIGNWMRQRTRWLKGWMQTWLVHMRDPVRLWSEVGATAFVVIQALTIGVVLAALCHPAFLIWTIASFIPSLVASDGLSLFELGVATLFLTVCFAGYAVAFCCAIRGGRKIDGRLWLFSALTMPIYWLLISLAAWRALGEFIVSPFAWNKTRHGVTRCPRVSQG